jgi:hypothetical protein
MQILEQKYDFIPERPAPRGLLVKLWQLNEYLELLFIRKLLGLQIVPAFLGKIKFAAIPFVIQNADEKTARQTVVSRPGVNAFGLDAGYVKSYPVIPGFELGVLHFYEIFVPGTVFAKDVKDNFFAFGSRPQKFCGQVLDFLYLVRKNPCEKVIYDSHEQRLAARFPKHAFKSPVNKKRSKPHWLKFACNNSSFSGHNNLLGKSRKQECDIIKGSANASGWKIENFDSTKPKKENEKCST